MSDADEYTLRWRGREIGPFPLSEINRQLDEHEIGMGHDICYQGKWITLEEFFASLPPPAVSAPPPPAQPRDMGAPTPQPRKPSTPKIKVSISAPPELPQKNRAPRHRMVYALLGVVAGFTGLHNFYARQLLTGLLQLLLSVATYLMGFGIIAAWIWAMAEAVFVRRDADGIEMI